MENWKLCDDKCPCLVIGTENGGEIPHEIALARSHLIAAAPNLLVALVIAKEHLERVFYWDAGERFCGHCKKSVQRGHQSDCPIKIISEAIVKAVPSGRIV